MLVSIISAMKQRHLRISTFASITEWFHGSALRLSEDDKGGFCSCCRHLGGSALQSVPPSSPSGGQRCNPFSLRRHPRGSALQTILNCLLITLPTRGPMPRCHINHSSQRLPRSRNGSTDQRLSEDDREGSNLAIIAFRGETQRSILASSPSGVRVANNSLTVVTLGLDPRAHAVMSHQS